MDFRKNTQISSFIKIRPVGAELCHTDGRTDRHNDANGRFLKFCERTWKQIMNATPGVNDCQIIFFIEDFWKG
jgi:hypothetical protein